MLTDPGSWPTITHQHEVFAMLGADRMSAGLQVLRDRPGYSTSVFQADDASEADRKAAHMEWLARARQGERCRRLMEIRIGARLAALAGQRVRRGPRDFGGDFVRSVWRPLVGWHATMSVRPEHAREIGETLWRVSMKQSGLLVEAE
jgi:hypothetical protein